MSVVLRGDPAERIPSAVHSRGASLDLVFLAAHDYLRYNDVDTRKALQFSECLQNARQNQSRVAVILGYLMGNPSLAINCDPFFIKPTLKFISIFAMTSQSLNFHSTTSL